MTTRTAASLSVDLAAQVREARKARGWTQQHLAAKAGVSAPLISSIEGGHRNLSWAVAEKIVAALGAHVRVELHPGVCPSCGCCPKCAEVPQ